MQTKKMGYFLSTLVLFSGLIYSVSASTTTVSFRGGGVTINLTFPEEAHPAESIWHNVTITAISPTTQLRNFTAVIKAPVNSSWVEIFNSQDTFSKLLPVSYNLTLSLPQGANGTLYCFMYVNTSSIDDLSTTFYTTAVREMTYSELLAGYNVLNNTYNQLVADFDTLNNTYNDLRSSYELLNASYNVLNDTYYQLLSDYDQLSLDYSTLNDTYNNLQLSYAALNSAYNELSANYIILNNTHNDLQGRYTTLQNSYNELDSNYKNVNSARNSLLGDISKLQSDYDLLNSTFYNVQGNYTFLQGNFTDLQAVYDALKETYNNLLSDLNDLQGAVDTDKIVMFIFIVTVACLVAFIIYIKRKQPEPYVVIRKETVAMKPDEKS
jgi:predicted nuclease with TOPRIM domain